MSNRFINWKWKTILAIIILMLFSCSCGRKQEVYISTPDKIIIYKQGKTYEMEKDNKFNEIVKLTNDRITYNMCETLSIKVPLLDTGFISTPEGEGWVQGRVEKAYKQCILVEFVYNKPQKFTKLNFDFTYSRLLFPLDGNDNAMMFYGPDDKYNNAFGGLEDSTKLLKLIK